MKEVKCINCMALGGLKFETPSHQAYCKYANQHVNGVYEQHDCEKYMFYD